jgi:hypothetical protein
MPDKETPVVRYRSLAEECRKAAKTLSTSDRKEVLEMAEEWDGGSMRGKHSSIPSARCARTTRYAATATNPIQR